MNVNGLASHSGASISTKLFWIINCLLSSEWSVFFFSNLEYVNQFTNCLMVSCNFGCISDWLIENFKFGWLEVNSYGSMKKPENELENIS